MKNDSKLNHHSRFPSTPSNYLYRFPSARAKGGLVTQAHKNLPSLLSLLQQCFWMYCFSKVIHPLKTWFYEIYKCFLFYAQNPTEKLLKKLPIMWSLTNINLFMVLFQGNFQRCRKTRYAPQGSRTFKAFCYGRKHGINTVAEFKFIDHWKNYYS